MPVHDWARVDVEVFQDFRHAWIEEIRRALNNGGLQETYYAAVEAGMPAIVPDGDTPLLVEVSDSRGIDGNGQWFVRRTHSVVVVRHVRGDDLVGVVEILSPAVHAGRNGTSSYVARAARLLRHRVHLLIVEIFPIDPLKPGLIPGLIMKEVTGHETSPRTKPMTLVSFEAGSNLECYIADMAVGDDLGDMPLFLQPGRYASVPLETTYLAAFNALARRWRDVLQPPPA